VITVRAIAPDKYPHLQKNPENPFSTMDPEARIAEIDSFCARLWARACMEAARNSTANRTKKAGLDDAERGSAAET
jgi:hypothetical protein